MRFRGMVSASSYACISNGDIRPCERMMLYSVLVVLDLHTDGLSSSLCCLHCLSDTCASCLVTLVMHLLAFLSYHASSSRRTYQSPHARPFLAVFTSDITFCGTMKRTNHRREVAIIRLHRPQRPLGRPQDVFYPMK